MERETSVRASNLAPRDWESSTLGTWPKVYLPSLPYVLPVVGGGSAKFTLADPPNLVPSTE